ncbi:MAG: hypothetical protein JSW25_02850, partial [Thermoplasmata archaeon]
YIDADSDGNPESFEAYQEYTEADDRWAKSYLNNHDADTDGTPELIEFYSVGQWDTMTWTEAAKLVDADSDGNPESFEAFQELVLGPNVWGKRYLTYTDADSDGNPEDVTFYEEAKFHRVHYVAFAHLVDADSDGNPELIEAARAVKVGMQAIAMEGLKYVDDDSDGNPESVGYLAMAANDDGSIAVRGLEYTDADSDGNPETIKAFEGLKVEDELVAARGIEVTDADSDGNPEKVGVLAFVIGEEGKIVEAAEWVDADGDGNPESIKAWRHLETTSGVEIAQAFEYVDADSDGNPEKVTYYEIGTVTFEDDAVAAVAESRDELPPMEELSDVEAPSTEDLSLPRQVGEIQEMEAMTNPHGDMDMKPWETEGSIAAALP